MKPLPDSHSPSKLVKVLVGVISIANTLVMAMLERRRELGILKSAGYTSDTVLSENGIIGGLGTT